MCGPSFPSNRGATIQWQTRGDSVVLYGRVTAIRQPYQSCQFFARRPSVPRSLTPLQRETYLLENESDVRTHYESCERKYGRTPSNAE